MLGKGQQLVQPRAGPQPAWRVTGLRPRRSGRSDGLAPPLPGVHPPVPTGSAGPLPPCWGGAPGPDRGPWGQPSPARPVTRGSVLLARSCPPHTRLPSARRAPDGETLARAGSQRFPPRAREEASQARPHTSVATTPLCCSGKAAREATAWARVPSPRDGSSREAAAPGVVHAAERRRGRRAQPLLRPPQAVWGERPGLGPEQGEPFEPSGEKQSLSDGGWRRRVAMEMGARAPDTDDGPEGRLQGQLRSPGRRLKVAG